MCYSLCYNAPTMLPAIHRPVTSWVHYTTSCNTQSSVPEDGQNNCPKHVELPGIINHIKAKLNPTCHLLALLGAHHIFHVSGIRVNKPLLLHLVGCLYCIY